MENGKLFRTTLKHKINKYSPDLVHQVHSDTPIQMALQAVTWSSDTTQSPHFLHLYPSKNTNVHKKNFIRGLVDGLSPQIFHMWKK